MKIRNRILLISTLSVILLSLVSCASAGGSAENESSVDLVFGKRSFTGWIDTSNHNISTTVGLINLKTITKLGTFNIGVQNDDGKIIPVINNSNEYTTSGFYLKVDDRVYKLVSESNIKSSARRTNTGMHLEYCIKDVADVYIDFECMPSVEGEKVDLLKISSTVRNRGRKRSDFALKIILDTVLGENDKAHFYTSSELPVSTEVLCRNPDEEKWYLSKNNEAQMQVIFSGADITEPEIVALANYSTMAKDSWEPVMTSYRTFDTVLSYNNSAVGIIWPSKKIGIEGRNKNVFYLSFSTNGSKPMGDVYINNKLFEDLEEDQFEGFDSVEEAVNAEIEKEQKEAEEKKIVEVMATESDDAKTLRVEVAGEKTMPAVEPAAEEPEVKPEPEVVEPQVKKEERERKYSPDYIDALIDRIEELENNPSEASVFEMELLNQELDQILNSF